VYTFKNSPSEKSTTVVLSEYSFSLHSGGNEVLMLYANILLVRLKKSGKKFFTIIKPIDKPEIWISNVFAHSSNESEDCSPQYNAFVRTLHFHLKEKSMAYYVCGNNLQNILLSACALVILAFGISYSLESSLAYNSNSLALGLSFISITSVAIVNWRHFPNVYKPDHIPLQYLPAM
jgi:hypothetical protein